MASTDLDVTSVIVATGWTGATVGNLDTSDDNRATDGLKDEYIHCEMDNVPGDFGSMNTVTLHVEGSRPAAGDRTMSFTVGLYDSGDLLLESFTTADLGLSDVTYDSSAFSRADSSGTIDGWRLRVTVNEGGGMPGGDDTSRVDRMWATLDYNVAGGTTPYYYNKLLGYGGT